MRGHRNGCSACKLFRISLSRGHEIICIADEVEHARNYLTIQKIRYKDKFDYTIEMDPALNQNERLSLFFSLLLRMLFTMGLAP